MGDFHEDIAQVHLQGLKVDDDNEPAPKNVPTTHAHDHDTDNIMSTVTELGITTEHAAPTLTTPTQGLSKKIRYEHRSYR